MICYVDSSWSFSSINDKIGFEINDPTPLDRFQKPTETIYIADNEDGNWRAIVTGLNDPQLVTTRRLAPHSDLKFQGHGSRPVGVVFPTTAIMAVLTSFITPGNADWMKAGRMTVDMWREIW